MLRTLSLALLSAIVVMGMSELKAKTAPKAKTSKTKLHKKQAETDTIDDVPEAQQNHEPRVIVYSSPMCSYCTSAKELLLGKKIEFKEINVQGNRSLIDEMEKRTGKRTVPQIMIDGQHLGGYSSLLAANMSGELDEKLAATPKSRSS